MDVGVELRKRLSTQDPPSLMVGSAWQVRLQVLSIPTAIPQLFTSTSHPVACFRGRWTDEQEPCIEA